ncbi:MAG TPA: type I-E CRISPR-associated protein Cas6/Cse3/CasE [Burkholderiaceae bacterium]|nr:type I-E CRISPR-associated protein Cas6/Cse3/CasE [Burkholderiaceae bacterium]
MPSSKTLTDKPAAGAGRGPDRRKSSTRSSGGEFVHSVLSFTRLEIPEVEVFETVVTFAPDVDPLEAHDRLAAVFGHKAGDGHFMFRADSEAAGRYWVQSVDPWPRWPEGATTTLEPSRRIIQLEGGLMYQFSLVVCTGRERIENGQKHIEPYATAAEFEDWFSAVAPEQGFKLLMHSAAVDVLRFRHAGKGYKVGLGRLDGALEVVEAQPMKRAILRGFGSHRRLGLGMLQLSR